MVNSAGFEIPPPGGELETVTKAGPSFSLARSSAVISAVSWELSLKVVGLAIPFQRTTDRDSPKK